MPRNICLILIMFATLALPVSSPAATIVDMAHGEAQFVKISRKDLNRIVTPHEDPKVFTASQAVDVKIEGKNIFVRTQDSFTTAELFIISSDRTYSLILVPTEIPAQTIVIRDPAANAKEADTWEKSHDYVNTIKSLIKGMASDTVPEGYEIVTAQGEKETKYLFKNCVMTLTREFRGFRLRGIEYRIENPGPGKLTFLENEFHAPGILAVSIDRHTLDPKDQTRVYIVKEASGD